ncbi:RNA polymerase subunit sigma [Chitinophaga silvatica]|uniref:RNA polymerase subunit sigma n=1 Tax=Chitinophaga silvatica TaxID=2282649 RepID=A0A3E1YAH0_9BACT|nr:sigma-70 family RNA polymerase sigma factor [Chitinophaga silvatica]RFS22710.1 RNA polymerase subunit sigma [Chitinophaga silvatica]
MGYNESLKQLFQKEFAKMVAVISKKYGLQNITLAEDIISETFLTAAEYWGMNGMPDNPTAWLYAVARQKLAYQFRRQSIYNSKVLPAIKPEEEAEEMQTPDFSPEQIRDSQLQMLFAICNPAIASESQIGLALRILCGFGIDEIAEAFLTSKDTINKRLYRAKEKLREEKVDLAFPDPAVLPARLQTVLRIIYLLFNEGYYSQTQNEILRKELCIEALRLGLMLTEYAPTNLPETHALIALMCFNASRLDARISSDTSAILYEEQDEDLWDKQLIRQGIRYLGSATTGSELTTYHLEARIASWHIQKEDTPEKWNSILWLYDQLLLLSYSHSIALNRLYALYKAKGKAAALPEVLALNMENNHFYWLLLAELHHNEPLQRSYYEKALRLAKSGIEQQVISKKIDQLS